MEEDILAWRETAKRWFLSNGRRVSIVIPSFRDRHLLAQLLDGLLACAERDFCDVVIVDDHSDDAEQEAYLRQIETRHAFVTIVRGDTNVGFAANVNRGLAIVDASRDVVLMNSDIVPRDGWLAALQYSLHLEPADIIAPKLLYPDGRIQFGGGQRSFIVARSFDHTHRFRAEDFPPSTVRVPILFATGAAMYIVASARQRLGLLDESFAWSCEDVDYCLRNWLSGGTVAFEPRSVLVHHESATSKAHGVRDAELKSRARLWEKMGAFFQRSSGDAGRPPTIFVLDNSAGGTLQTHIAHTRAIFGVMARLADAGHRCEIWSTELAPHLLDRRIAVRGFKDNSELAAELANADGIKVATSWQTAETVWLSSIVRGLPAFLVTDAPGAEARASAAFRPEFSYLTISDNVAGWLKDQLDITAPVFGGRAGDREAASRLAAEFDRIARGGYGLPVGKFQS